MLLKMDTYFTFHLNINQFLYLSVHNLDTVRISTGLWHSEEKSYSHYLLTFRSKNSTVPEKKCLTYTVSTLSISDQERGWI